MEDTTNIKVPTTTNNSLEEAVALILIRVRISQKEIGTTAPIRAGCNKIISKVSTMVMLEKHKNFHSSPLSVKTIATRTETSHNSRQITTKDYKPTSKDI